MPVSPRGLAGLLTGTSIALLIFVASGHAPFSFGDSDAVAPIAAAIGPVAPHVPPDALETGSIGPAVQANLTAYVPLKVTMSPLPLALPEPHAGSEQFQQALALLETDPVGAFERAATLNSAVEKRTIEWAAIYYGSGKVNYRDVLAFAAAAPAFADTSIFRTRLEQAVLRADADGATIIEALGGRLPNTIDAQIALALAYVADGQKPRAAVIAQQIWASEFLDKQREDRFYKKLGGLLTADDHWARAVHLMMHDRATATDRLLPFLTDAQKTLVKARSAVSRDAKDAGTLLEAVDASLKTHPVFMYSQVQQAHRAKDWDGALAWLAKATGPLPDAAEWWSERRALSRDLLAQGKTDLAYKVAAGYSVGPAPTLVDAQFQAGWIALTALKDAKAAAGHFARMQGAATTPESTSQAYFWLGRAKLTAGDKLGANEAFANGAEYRTIYYGLLSRAELGQRGVLLKDMPDQTLVVEAFEQNEIVQAVRLLAGNGEGKMAQPLLRSFAFGLEDGGELRLAAELADEINAPSLAIKIAEDADKRGTPLDLVAFPRDRLPVTHVAEVDHAALYAITRQESHFQLDAVSSAGARGLMQLMPGTARETAEKVGVEYSKSRLVTDGAYNALLGSTYLAAQLDRYEGSLVLAAAAYNAGPGNANKWIKANGDPRDTAIDPAVWIEQIPVNETRNYVKRVLGNYLVYRSQLGRDDISMLEALRRIR
ncbi:MAG TPA: lytic transglycosylase domain-containing protein [Devosia sp.]|nr:lytic transglycosylase domain-containing protein [Devosia sp.]